MPRPVPRFVPRNRLDVRPSPSMKANPDKEKWWLTHGPFEDPEKNALDHLQRYNFEIDQGWIYPPKGFELSKEDRMAIDYLCDEYDYEYEPLPQ